MPSASTLFVNCTDKVFELKEGNAGVFRNVATLQPQNDKTKNSYKINLDPNATYREYVVATGMTGEKVLVTSDECYDSSTIEIVKENDKYVAKPSPRGSKSPREANDQFKLQNIWIWLKKLTGGTKNWHNIFGGLPNTQLVMETGHESTKAVLAAINLAIDKQSNSPN